MSKNFYFTVTPAKRDVWVMIFFIISIIIFNFFQRFWASGASRLNPACFFSAICTQRCSERPHGDLFCVIFDDYDQNLQCPDVLGPVPESRPVWGNFWIISASFWGRVLENLHQHSVSRFPES